MLFVDVIGLRRPSAQLQQHRVGYTASHTTLTIFSARSGTLLALLGVACNLFSMISAISLTSSPSSLLRPSSLKLTVHHEALLFSGRRKDTFYFSLPFLFLRPLVSHGRHITAQLRRPKAQIIITINLLSPPEDSPILLGHTTPLHLTHPCRLYPTSVCCVSVPSASSRVGPEPLSQA